MSSVAHNNRGEGGSSPSHGTNLLKSQNPNPNEIPSPNSQQTLGEEEDFSHLLKEIIIERHSGGRTDYGVNPALRAKRRLSLFLSIFVDPLLDLSGSKSRQTIEAATAIALK